MGLELKVVISANINSTIAVILQKKLSLYDLQKPRYIYGEIAATPKKGRGHFEVIIVYPNYVTKPNLMWWHKRVTIKRD